jgi:hypothetical protein
MLSKERQAALIARRSIECAELKSLSTGRQVEDKELVGDSNPGALPQGRGDDGLAISSKRERKSF